MLSFTFSGTIWAQSGGTLKGSVIDDNGKFPLPTVRIAVMKTKVFGTTDPEGNFTIGNIPPGVYNVAFELSGYVIEVVKDVAIQVGGTTAIEVTMKMGFAHETTVTARREVTSLQRVPQNIEVLTLTEIEETPAVNIVQAMNNITGVDVATGKNLTGLGTFMSVHGYEDVYARKMVDGVDVGEVVSNWSMLNSYPAEMLEQIEVIKGGASSVWGSNMAGIINVVTRRPHNMEKPQITLKGTFSTFGEQDFGNASAVPQSGNMQRFGGNIIGSYQNLGYMLGYDYNNADLFTDNGKNKNQSLFAKVGYDFSETAYLDFLYNYNSYDQSTHEFLETDLFKPWVDYYYNYNTAATASNHTASLKYRALVSSAWNLEAQAKFHQQKGEFTNEYLERGAIGYPGLVEESSFSDQKLGFTVKGAYNPNTVFSMVTGVDYYRIKADFTGQGIDQPVINVDELAPFINAVYRLGRLGLNAGFRYDYNSSFGSQPSPSFGANLNLLNATIIRANIARTFFVPPLWYTLGESYMDLILPNPDLLPERAWAYSAGFESQDLRYIYLKFSVYYHDMTDGIVRVPADEEGRFTWGNSDDFVRKGYEAELGFLTPIGLSGYVGTNYNDHKNTTDDSIVGWIPTRTYKVQLKYQHTKWDFFANLRGRWVWWNMDEFLTELFEPRDEIFGFDLRLSKGFRIGGSTRMAFILDVYNITDRLYWDRKDDPNPRLWGQLGFELKFN
jgi:outer membrane receptor protein involved in Fe transport